MPRPSARSFAVSCQRDDCEAQTLVLIEDGRVAGYQPRCNHQQRWTYIEGAAHAHKFMAEAGPDQDANPRPTGNGPGEPPAEATYTPCSCGGPYRFRGPSRCWCGEHEWPAGHGLLHCDSEAGHERDRGLEADDGE